MVEEIISVPKTEAHTTLRGLSGKSTPQRLSEIAGEEEDRLPLSIHEFSRVLGGGIVPGSIVLIGGDPGIGKSTLLLQVAMEMAIRNNVLYTSGEESERQIKMRALRLQNSPDNLDGSTPTLPKNLFLVTETNLSIIFDHISEIK